MLASLIVLVYTPHNMAKAPGKNSKDKEVGLETVLWNCRVALRGVGSMEKNRDAVIGLVFLKFAGDKFTKRYNEIQTQFPANPEFLDEVAFYNAVNVYYLKETARWSYLVKNASQSNIAVIIDQAMADIEAANPPLKGALPQNLFAALAAPKEIKALIDEVNKIDESRFHEEDLIGRVYEYFLRLYAASAGSNQEGEFYTPACIVKLIAELIEPYKGKVYDPCCGSGGMFVQSHKFVEKHQGDRSEVSVIGQEKNPDTWRLCKMNLAIRGIAHNLGEKHGSTFTEEMHKDLKVDYIMANPPFNLKGWRTEKELTNDPRFKGFATPPPSNANYAWILHMLSKLDPSHGVAGFLLANGALNADSVEYEIRKELLERDKVEAIMVLPRDMFYTTDLSVTLWILNMNKCGGEQNGRLLRDRRNEILFMDLRGWDSNVEEILIDKGKKKKKTVLTDSQISEAKSIYEAWRGEEAGYQDVPELCRAVSLREIRDKGYTLAPSKYIEFVDKDLAIDYESEMQRFQENMRSVLSAELQAQSDMIKAFRGIGYAID